MSQPAFQPAFEQAFQPAFQPAFEQAFQPATPDPTRRRAARIQTLPESTASSGRNEPQLTVRVELWEKDGLFNEPVVSSEMTLDFVKRVYEALRERMAVLESLEHRQQLRLAGVLLSETALKMLYALNQDISIRWEDLPGKTGSDWEEVCSSVALLAGSHLCESTPNWCTISDYGTSYVGELHAHTPPT